MNRPTHQDEDSFQEMVRIDLELGTFEKQFLEFKKDGRKVVKTFVDIEKCKTYYGKEAKQLKLNGEEISRYINERIELQKQSFKERMERAVQLPPHPNIVQVHKVEVDKRFNQLCAVSDFVSSSKIGEAIHAMPIKSLIPILIGVSKAVGHIHDSNLLHLNLKNRYVLITSTKEGKLTPMLASCGYLHPIGLEKYPYCGSAACIAPELAIENRADKRSDIFSFGVWTYNLLSGGMRPFSRGSGGEGRKKILEKIKEETLPKPPSFFNSKDGVHKLDNWVMKMLSKGPNDRHPTFYAVTNELLEIFPANIQEAEDELLESQYVSTPE